MAWFIDEIRVWRLHIQYQEEGVWPLVTVWIDVKKLLRLLFTDRHLQAKHQSTFPMSTYWTIAGAQKQTHKAGKSHLHFKDKETEGQSGWQIYQVDTALTWLFSWPYDTLLFSHFK